MAVSAAQGLGTGDLLDRLVELLPPDDGAPDEDEDLVRLAIIGRPNVGKSSLVNAFLGRERVIVSEVAGTTRDAIDTELEVDGRHSLRLVDTAGIRRQAKVQESVEYYTVLRSQRAAERADVALVVCDASDGVTSQDLRIAELAMKSGCATALVLNKWDLTSGDEFDLEHERRRVAQKLRLRPRVMTASAMTGRHVQRLLVEVLSLAERAARPHPDARSSTASSPTSSPSASRRRSRATGSSCSTSPRSASARRASPSRSTTATSSRATTPTSSRTGCASATRWRGSRS